MNFLIEILLFLASSTTLFFMGMLGYSFWKKSKIETGININCYSGDQETMTFSTNFFHGEGLQAREDKIDEAFEYIDRRRQQTHEKMMEIRKQALEENAEKEKNGEQIKLKSVMEGS